LSFWTVGKFLTGETRTLEGARHDGHSKQ
jgi:hypothetical protein